MSTESNLYMYKLDAMFLVFFLFLFCVVFFVPVFLQPKVKIQLKYFFIWLDGFIAM